MKNTRWFRMIACFLAMMMVFALSQFVAFAEEGTGEDNGQESPANEMPAEEQVTVSEEVFIEMSEAPYHESLDIRDYVTVSYLDASGKAVTPEAMDPNQSNQVQLVISGLDADAEITKDTTLLWTVPEEITLLTGEGVISDEVTGQLDGETLRLSWIDAKADQVTVTVSVLPHLSTANNLSGKYALITAGNVMMGAEAYIDTNDGNRGKLTSYPVEIDGGVIRPKTTNNSVWELTHVTGDYYTVYSVTAGQYLRICPPGTNGFKKGSVILESVAEEEAQKILVQNGGNGYTFQFLYKGKKYGINNSSNGKFYAGFASYDAENKDHYKFGLYSASSVTDSATVDLSGSWTIVNERRCRILTDTVNESGLGAVAYNINDAGVLIPNDNIDEWTFEHITRDWYYISSGGNYLNIDENGVFLSGTPEALLVQSNNGFRTFMVTDGNFARNDGQFYALRAKDDNSFDKVRTSSFDDYRQFSRIDSDQIASGPVNLSGSWAITTAASGAALIAEQKGSLLASVPYVMTEDGKVYNLDTTISYWNFTQVNGNWYTVTTDSGLYLTIGAGSLSLSSAPAQVFIQEYDGAYRLTAGNQYALNNSKGNPTAGYSSYGNGKAKDKNEWHTLRRVFEGAKNVLAFNANGGTTSSLPSVIMGEVGDTVTLPGMEASKDGGAFIGWSEDKNFYSKLSSANYTYRVLLTPGTEYRLSEGANTLYAVYDTTSRDVQFGIRVDGVIQDEPSDNKVEAYKGHFTLNNVRKAGHWVIDIRSTRSVNGYYLENNVTAALTRVPTSEEIVDALKDDGITFDPEAQYIHWYVMKYNTNNGWHIDGVIRSKKAVSVTYDMNVDNTAERSKIKDLPGAYQVPAGTQILIGSAENSKTIKTPTREGYVFIGWNTEADGSGTTYSGGEYMRLTQNLHLFAQWKDVSNGKLAITITSDWPQGKPAYDGTRITLTANLTGFENKDYTLQWQYSDDNRENWNDQPGENGMTMTYEMSKTTANYIWRVIAKDVTDKK